MLDALVAAAGIDPAAVDDVIVGCVGQIGEQSFHIGRNMVLASSLPESVPAVTIDRQCGSSQQSVHFAAQAVMSGTQDVVIAAGVESMTRVPMGLPIILPLQAGIGTGPWPRAASSERFGVSEFSQFTGAEMIAREYRLHPRASSTRSRSTATARRPPRPRRGAFDREIVPAQGHRRRGQRATPHRRRGHPLRRLDGGPRVAQDAQADGVVTAGNASQICDGASGVLVVSERALKEHGLTPLARIDAMTVTAGDPVIMLMEPIPATRRALERVGPQHRRHRPRSRSTRRSRRCRWPGCAIPAPIPARLNVNGGAIALGHPLGASGAKLMATLVHALRARGLRYGLQTMCEGGGIANATIIEAL